MWGEVLLSKAYWLELLKSEFNRGYTAGVLTILLLLVLWLILRLFFLLVFRTKRCGEVVVPLGDGDLTISSDAVESTARQLLENYVQLSVRKIQLYRRGKIYLLQLYCRFMPGADGLPALAGKLKPELTALLKETFGIENLTEIRIRVEKTVEGGNISTPKLPDVPPADATETEGEANVIYPGF